VSERRVCDVPVAKPSASSSVSPRTVRPVERPTRQNAWPTTAVQCTGLRSADALRLKNQPLHRLPGGVAGSNVRGDRRRPGVLARGALDRLTVRGETLDDADGFATGTSQTLRSLTISPWYFYREAQEGVFSNVEFTDFRLPAFSIRPALRIDHSSQPVFETKGGTLKQSNLTALVELVFVF